MEHNSVPIIFGITGHRDLRTSDIKTLKLSVSEIFKSYQKEYNNTELILISALAEGADMLVAEVAKDLGVTLKIILPYEEQSYLRSFGNQNEAIQQYNDLKTYASDAPYNLNCIENVNTEDCYQALGEYIADASNILIALYDGFEMEKRGGTSAIVKYAENGFEENMFDPLNGNAIFLVNTPRVSNPKIHLPFQLNKRFLGMMNEEKFKNMLRNIEDLNAESQAKIASRNEPMLLERFHNYFDEQANRNQKKYKNSMVVVLLFTWIAIVFLELMHNLNGVKEFKSWAEHLIVGYGFGLIVAYVIYKLYMKKGKLQDDFVFSRAFSEAIRIQNSWSSVVHKEPVSKYYLKNQSSKFTWMRIVLKNLYFLHDTSSLAKDAPFENHNDWITGQIAYFDANIPKREASVNKVHGVEKTLFWIGVTSMFFMFSIYLLELFKVIQHGHFPYNWHSFVFVSGFSFLSSGFLNKYSRIKGYHEDYYNYKYMRSNFVAAKERLSENCDEKCLHKIIYDLGRKALEENSKWVELHENRRAKPEFD